MVHELDLPWLGRQRSRSWSTSAPNRRSLCWKWDPVTISATTHSDSFRNLLVQGRKALSSWQLGGGSRCSCFLASRFWPLGQRWVEVNAWQRPFAGFAATAWAFWKGFGNLKEPRVQDGQWAVYCLSTDSGQLTSLDDAPHSVKRPAMVGWNSMASGFLQTVSSWSLSCFLTVLTWDFPSVGGRFSVIFNKRVRAIDPETTPNKSLSTVEFNECFQNRLNVLRPLLGDVAQHSNASDQVDARNVSWEGVFQKLAEIDAAFFQQLSFVEYLLLIAYLVKRDILVTVGRDPGLFGAVWTRRWWASRWTWSPQFERCLPNSWITR